MINLLLAYKKIILFIFVCYGFSLVGAIQFSFAVTPKFALITMAGNIIYAILISAVLTGIVWSYMKKNTKKLASITPALSAIFLAAALLIVLILSSVSNYLLNETLSLNKINPSLIGYNRLFYLLLHRVINDVVTLMLSIILVFVVLTPFKVYKKIRSV